VDKERMMPVVVALSFLDGWVTGRHPACKSLKKHMPLILNDSHLQHLIHLENICYDGNGDSGGGGSNVDGDVCSSALGLDQYQYRVSADTRQYR